MKRTIATILSLSLMSTAALAVTCEPTYVTRWSYEYNAYVNYPGPERCYYVDSGGDIIYLAPGALQPPPPAPPPVVVYRDNPGPDLGSVLVGGLIGAGIGYAIGHNNHTHKNYYYNYYNGHRHGKHYRPRPLPQ